MIPRRVLLVVAFIAALPVTVALDLGTVGAQIDLKPVAIETVPTVAGVRLELDGTTVMTNEEGRADFVVEERRGVKDRLEVIDRELDDPDGVHRYRFNRLFGQGELIQVTFNVDRQVTFSFATISGIELGPDDIDTLHIKSSVGARLDDVPLDEPVWLDATRIQSTQAGPVVTDILWSVERVMVGTSNVVNRAQVRFTPLERSHVHVELLYYSARFRVSDLFFGNPTGESIVLTDPGGTRTEYPLDEDGTVSIERLPRGEYRVLVLGQGLKLERPVTLSRDQDEELEYLTYLDLGVAGVVVGLFITAPLTIGIIRRRRRRAQEAA